jgi:hypothetical protein
MAGLDEQAHTIVDPLVVAMTEEHELDSLAFGAA